MSDIVPRKTAGSSLFAPLERDSTERQAGDIPPTPGLDSAEELQAIAEKMNELARVDKPTVHACVTIIVARRLYFMGLDALHRRLEELGPKKGGPTVERGLAISAEQKANEPFERRSVLDTLQGHTLPWLLQELADEGQREREDAVVEAAASADQRKTRLEALGFLRPHRGVSHLAHPNLAEEATVVLGRPEAIGALFAAIVAALQHARRQDHWRILRLTTDATLPVNARRGQSLRVAPSGAWAARIGNHDDLADLVKRQSRFLEDETLELLLVDDLACFQSPPEHWRDVRARESLKFTNRWARKSQVACVLGLSLDPPPALAEHAYVIEVTLSAKPLCPEEPGCCELRGIGGDHYLQIRRVLHEESSQEKESGAG